MTNKKILITGITGFIGGYLSSRLLKEEGYELFGLCLEEPKNPKLNIQYHLGDLFNFERIKEIIDEIKPNIIIHLAAQTEVEKSFYDPIDFQKTNYNGTVHLIEAAKDSGDLELFIFASTMETYGAVPEDLWQPFTELTPQFPNAPYAVAKVGCEYYIKYAGRAYGFPYCILRQANTYGRKDNDFFVVEQIITQMLKNPKEINLGYADPIRNFTFIDDLIDFYLEILKNPSQVNNEIFCTGEDNALSIKELVSKIADKLKWKGKINWNTKPKRVGEIYYLNSSCEKAKRILGWSPKINLDEGLDRVIKIWKQNLGL